MNHKIAIDDLAHPRLTETQQQALAFTETLNIQISTEKILADASRKVELSDFGNPEFIRRLQLLCDEWEKDSGLTHLSKLTLCSKLVLYARNRLLIHDLLKRHPEIHGLEIKNPIIVCGLPRSGTTHLLNLMATDTRLCSLPLWESCEPLPLPGETTDYQQPQNDPRYKRCLKQWQNQQQMTPLLAAIQPMNPEHIHEELELMGPDFASCHFEWLAHSPRWRDEYYQHDQTPHYEYMKTVLKILQWQRGHTEANSKRWILKCPQHLEQLPVLRKVFPDATIIITHRDPVAVIQSTITLLAYGQRINRQQVQPQELLHYWSDRIEHLLRACVQDRKNIPDNISLDIPFHEFMADDPVMIRRIYQKANLEMTPVAEQQLSAFIRANPRGKHSQVQYNLQHDFGISPQALRERFRFYFDTFPVQTEA